MIANYQAISMAGREAASSFARRFFVTDSIATERRNSSVKEIYVQLPQTKTVLLYWQTLNFRFSLRFRFIYVVYTALCTFSILPASAACAL